MLWGKNPVIMLLLGPGIRCFRLEGPTQPTQQYNTISSVLLYTLIDPSHGHFLLNGLCQRPVPNSYSCSAMWYWLVFCLLKKEKVTHSIPQIKVSVAQLYATGGPLSWRRRDTFEALWRHEKNATWVRSRVECLQTGWQRLEKTWFFTCSHNYGLILVTVIKWHRFLCWRSYK